MPRRVVIDADVVVPSTKKIPVSSSDADSVIEEIGEDVTVYDPTQELDDDYGTITSSTLGDGAVETAFVDKPNQAILQMVQGNVKLGDIMLYLKSSSTIGEDSIVKVNGTGRYYRLRTLREYRIGGHKHHFEALAEFVKET